MDEIDVNWKIFFYETTFSGSNLIEDFKNLKYIPRKGENVILGYVEYKVTEVRYDLVSRYIRITLFSLGTVPQMA